jgi:hypothetical protein
MPGMKGVNRRIVIEITTKENVLVQVVAAGIKIEVVDVAKKERETTETRVGVHVVPQGLRRSLRKLPL